MSANTKQSPNQAPARHTGKQKPQARERGDELQYAPEAGASRGGGSSVLRSGGAPAPFSASATQSPGPRRPIQSRRLQKELRTLSKSNLFGEKEGGTREREERGKVGEPAVDQHHQELE
jgi:hypothetical protein